MNSVEDAVFNTPEKGIRLLLDEIAPDPESDSLKNTPTRWVKAIREMTSGYSLVPTEILSVSFEDYYDEMVVLRGIRFSSLCEHHLLPFIGQATVGYLPSGGKVVGLSKLARLVECHARRLQIQERMTRDIASDLMADPLNAAGAGVIVRAEHSCMACRGIRKEGAEMVTSSMMGAMEEAHVKSELLGLAGIR